MEKNKFIELVAEHILEYMPESYKEATVEVMERAKNNDTKLHGLIIRNKNNEGWDSAPILYLDSYFDVYRFGGKDMEDIMHEIAREYDLHSRNIPQFELPEMTRDGIGDKVYVKVINTRTNQERLKDLVNLPVDGGFSLTVYIDMDMPKKDAMIQVTKDMAEKMDYDERELMQDAMQNTISAYPAELAEMYKVMMDVSGLRRLVPEDNMLNAANASAEDVSMLVVTNSDKFFGATALFYPEMEKRIAEIVGGSYYVLPSSVHEMIVLPDNGTLEERELAQMVRTVNAAEVHPEEQLGNKVLYYNAAHERLSVAVDLDREKERGKER